MANDIPEVYIRVVADTGEVQRNLTAAELAFLKFQNKTKKGRKSWGSGMTKSFAKMAAGVFAVERAMSALTSVAKSMIKDVSDFQIMSVELKVATGSAMAAEEAFSMLQRTAKRLPSSLKDITTGFVRLKNMGLEATESTLVSFSNTAAAMGKSLKQFVEAVADANTREFERLKEFGILARNQGETIKFVFRGATKEVANSSKDIVKFLTDIGQTEFAGAATDQIDTLAARFTKLQDSLFNLNIAFGEGATGALGDFLAYLTEKADTTTFNKGVNDLNESLRKTVDITSAFNFEGALGGPSTQKIRKSGAALRHVFRNLTAKEFPSAIHLLEEQKNKLAQITDQSSALYIGERKRMKSMWEGFKVAEKRLKVERARVKAVEDKNAAHAKSMRMTVQQDKIAIHWQEEAFQLRLQAANEQENIIALVGLEAEARRAMIPIAAQLGMANSTEVFSAAQIDSMLRAKSLLNKQVLEIQKAIVGFTEDEAEATAKIVLKRAEGRVEREKDMKKRMAFAMEVGDIENYNSERSKIRNLKTNIALSEGANLVAALKEKYLGVSDQISIIQEQLDTKGLGAEKVIELNDSLDILYTDLDATSKALADQEKKLTEWQKSMVSLFDDIKEGIADAIVEGEGFKGLISSILKEMAKTQIVNMLGGLGGTPGAGILSIFKKPKGAFTGGPVSSGVTRIVGEKGPEIFTPSGAGMITPNHRVGGRGGSTVVNTYNTFDIRGSEQEVQQMIASSVELSVNLAVTRNQDLKNRGSIR
tara:strand:- start:1856 stop:4144 length:2289 start_codon:yes stop_codon:yes gene_type:complete